MTLLKRFHVNGTTVSLMESDDDLTIEISPEYKKNREKIISYLHDEGILEEILAGNTNWENKK